MRISAVISLLALMVGVAVTTPSAQAQAASKTSPVPVDPIGRAKLTKAYGHAKNAAELAKGGVVVSEDDLAKTASSLTEAQLRREIGLTVDQAKTNFSRVKTGQQQLDIATHLHMARIRLTTDRQISFEEARENIRKTKQQGRLDSHAGAVQATVDAIHEGLKGN